MDGKKVADISINADGAQPMIEVSVPFGTKFAEAVKLHDLISRDIISKISPRGCPQCTSGVPVIFRERFKEVIQVDLQTMKPL